MHIKKTCEEYYALLSDRGLLGDVAFHEQWSEHNRGLNRFQGSFYSQYLQPLFYEALAKSPGFRSDTIRESFRDVPHLDGGLFEPILPDERDYDIPDNVMKLILSRFIEGKQRPVVNEGADGSLLETYTEGYESRDLARQIPQHYSTIVDAYSAEMEYVETQIERTVRSFDDVV